VHREGLGVIRREHGFRFGIIVVMDLRHDPGVVAAEVSGREAELLAAVGPRLTSREIAAELSISVRTVESHIASHLRKLEAPDRRPLPEMAIDAASRAAVPRPPRRSWVESRS
jgi:DNA-binding NarL/FixJ family response regulator